MKRTLYIPGDLWRRLQKAAAELGAKEGRPVSVSDYIRRAVEEKMERESKASRLRSVLPKEEK